MKHKKHNRDSDESQDDLRKEMQFRKHGKIYRDEKNSSEEKREQKKDSKGPKR